MLKLLILLVAVIFLVYSLLFLYALVSKKYANKKKILFSLGIALLALETIDSNLTLREMDTISAAQYMFSVKIIPVDAESGEPFEIGVIQTNARQRSRDLSGKFDADELRARLTNITQSFSSDGSYLVSGSAGAPVIIHLRGEGYQDELVEITEDTEDQEIRVLMTRNDAEN